MQILPIFSHPRSGSTFLMSLLAQASEYSSMMEPFHSLDSVRERNFKRLLEISRPNESNLDELLSELVRDAREKPVY